MWDGDEEHAIKDGTGLLVLSPPCGMVTQKKRDLHSEGQPVLSPPCGMVTLSVQGDTYPLGGVLSPPCGMVTHG